ncbi:hypothetical protein GCM10009037_06960 [Halarchaeum grantii]|uniref:Uncharacterized protein n=1 Tax=Halarchaeum grantii TaxID=1193105 RepID=A0A830EZV9_9EURY|nr:hypothetical protein [Halarchaeum grantii]GGL25943.1 hypothetical protein GCM10009037_06960 [Halarchaeum grantii]
MLKATADRFEEENDDLEAILEGDMGFHAYFVANGEDPTRGTHTAVFQGIYDVIEEVSVDAEIVEIRRGEVTPESVREEVLAQLDEHAHFSRDLREAIGDRVEKRVRKNMAGGESV